MNRKTTQWAALLASWLLIALCGNAQTTEGGKFLPQKAQPFAKPAVAKALKAQAPAEIAFVTVVDEDFSLWTAGTAEAPDAAILGGQEPDYLIDARYTKQPGWVGNGCHQAGGACALMAYEGSYGTSDGFISTPEMELYGDVVLTFRAKRFAASPDKGNLWVALCDNAQGIMDSKDFQLTSTWETYEMRSNMASFSSRNIIQISSEEGDVLIDDVKLERRRNVIPAPEVLTPINTSATSFVARWTRTSAPSYVLNVYYKDMPANYIPETTVTETFDQINLNADGTTIDTDNPNYPEGWTINVAGQGSQDAHTDPANLSSGKQALCFDAEGDQVVTPVAPAPIKSFSFWVRPSSMEQEPDWTYSILQISVLSESGWTPIANLPNYWMEEGGGVYSFNAEQLGDYVSQVKVEFIQKNLLTFAIDDISYTYETAPVPFPLIENKELADTFCVVEDIDPTKEHYYYVQAKEEGLISQPTYDMWVDGIIGVKPQIMQPTGVAPNGYTAHWEALYNADSYKLWHEQVIVAKEDMENVTVLHEDFNRITEGSVDEPGMEYSNTATLSDKGWTDTDWILQLPQWANGMAGAQATNFWMGKAGLVVSPRLTLNGGDGTFKVDVKAHNTLPGDTLFVMILKEHTDGMALDAQRIPFSLDEAAPMSGSVVFEGNGGDDNLRNGVKIAFMSLYGEPFFIDEVTITQNLKAGQSLFRPYQVLLTETGSHTFSGLPEGFDYAYRVQALRTKFFELYSSEVSDRMYVGTCNTSIAQTEAGLTRVSAGKGFISIQSAAGGNASVYDLQGRLLRSLALKAGDNRTALPPALYIVKVDGQAVKVAVP